VDSGATAGRSTLGPARNGHHRDAAPPLLVDRAERGSEASDLGHRGRQDVAHQAEFVARVFGRMNGGFGGWQGDDEPGAPGINRRESQRIAQELVGGFWGRREQETCAPLITGRSSLVAEWPESTVGHTER
jgi:hypothetical protein